MFYYSKTILFEVPGGPGRSLLGDLLRMWILGGIFRNFHRFWASLGRQDLQMGPYELQKRRKIRSGRVSKCAWYPRWVARVARAHFGVHLGRIWDGFGPTFRLILDDFWRWILECFWGETRNAQKSSWGGNIITFLLLAACLLQPLTYTGGLL